MAIPPSLPSLLTMGNDPSLPGRAGMENKALSDLQLGHVFETMKNRGAMDKQGLANVGSRDSAIVGRGFSGASDPGFNPEALKRIREVELAGKAGEALSAGAGGGVRARASELPLTLVQAALGPHETGMPLKMEAANRALNEVVDTDEITVEQKAFLRAKAGEGGVPGQIIPKTTTRRSKRQVKTRNTPQANAIAEAAFTAGVQDGTIIESPVKEGYFQLNPKTNGYRRVFIK